MCVELSCIQSETLQHVRTKCRILLWVWNEEKMHKNMHDIRTYCLFYYFFLLRPKWIIQIIFWLLLFSDKDLHTLHIIFSFSWIVFFYFDVFLFSFCFQRRTKEGDCTSTRYVLKSACWLNEKNWSIRNTKGIGWVIASSYFFSM